jgi:hypothetical protein
MSTPKLPSALLGAVLALLGAGPLSLLHSGCASTVTCTGDCTGSGAAGGKGGYGGYDECGYGGLSASNCDNGGGGFQDGTAALDCDCACGAGSPAALVCNDPNHPSFCAGEPPVTNGMCWTALQTICGFADEDIVSLPCSF